MSQHLIAPRSEGAKKSDNFDVFSDTLIPSLSSADIIVIIEVKDICLSSWLDSAFIRKESADRFYGCFFTACSKKAPAKAPFFESKFWKTVKHCHDPR